MTSKQPRDKDRQAKAMQPNQDKRAACFVTLTSKAFFSSCRSEDLCITHLYSHICQISLCSNRPPGTDLPAKRTIMPFLISAREDLKRKGKKKTHFPNKKKVRIGR